MPAIWLLPMPDGRPKLILSGFDTDYRSPFEERWGGWYVTGAMEHGRHMGNAMLNTLSLSLQLHDL